MISLNHDDHRGGYHSISHRKALKTHLTAMSKALRYHASLFDPLGSDKEIAALLLSGASSIDNATERIALALTAKVGVT
jgi:hypothetical protein